MKKMLIILVGVATLTISATINQEASANDAVLSADKEVAVSLNDTVSVDTLDLVEQVELNEDSAYTVTATMYNATVGQCDADPLTTAGMYTIDPEHASEQKMIAMSRDMLERWGGDFDYGDKVIIKGAGDKDGEYLVADTMNKRYTNRIDILETTGTPIYKFEDVKIYKV